MDEGVEVIQVGTKPRRYIVRLPILHGDDAVAMVVEKWDLTDDAPYWYCMRHRSIACPCVISVVRTANKDNTQ